MDKVKVDTSAKKLRQPIRTRSVRKAKGSGHERRAEILNAARDLFAAEGYACVTTRSIAARAGLSQTGLYIYFPTKEDILRAIGEETHDAMTAAFERAAAEPGSPRERFRRLIRAYLDYGLDHPADYQLTFTVAPEALAPLEKDFSRPADDQGAGARSIIRFAALIHSVAGEELLGGLDPLVVAQILWFAGHGAVSLLISRPHFPWADRQTLLSGLETLVVKGALGQTLSA